MIRTRDMYKKTGSNAPRATSRDYTEYQDTLGVGIKDNVLVSIGVVKQSGGVNGAFARAALSTLQSIQSESSGTDWTAKFAH